MSGEKKSLTAKDRLKEFEDKLNEYTEGLGFQFIRYNNEVDKILVLDEGQIRLLSESDCKYFAVILKQHSLFVQKEHNRQMVRKNWALNNLNILYGKEAKAYGDKWTSFDERKAMVITGDEFGRVLNEIVLYAEARAKELDFISRHINLIADSLSILKREKPRD